MNIEDKVKAAIEHIESMSPAEFEKELSRRGYKPDRKISVVAGLFFGVWA